MAVLYQGQVWEIELLAGQEPNPEWHIASQVQEDDRLKLRLVSAHPGGRAYPEEAYLVLMAEASGMKLPA